VIRLRFISPFAFALCLGLGTAQAAEQPTPTEPVAGTVEQQEVHTGTAKPAGAAEAAGEHVAAQEAHAAEGHVQAAEEVAEGHGEGHGGHAGVDPKTLAFQLLNFGALLFILVYFGGRALSKALRARHNQLKTDIEGAASRRAQAEQRFREQESRLASLEKELVALRAEVQQAGERERARLLEGAQEKAKRIQEETRFQLEQQVKEAELRLRAEVASTAIKVADELLKRSVGPDDERRLAQDFAAGAEKPLAGGVR
jgi:F-type H+-transporting ATPase subunit b